MNNTPMERAEELYSEFKRNFDYTKNKDKPRSLIIEINYIKYIKKLSKEANMKEKFQYYEGLEKKIKTKLKQFGISIDD